MIFKEHATKLPRCNTYSNRIVSDWNHLPKRIVVAISVDLFKAELHYVRNTVLRLNQKTRGVGYLQALPKIILPNYINLST